MATISSLRAALAARLSTISGLHVYESDPGRPVTPAAVIRPETINYGTSAGTYDVSFVVLLMTDAVSLGAGSDLLDSYLDTSGSKSINAAIQADFDLGGACDSASVTTMRNYGGVSVDDRQYLGAELVVEVLAQ